MGRMVDLDDIVSVDDIAKRYELTRQAVNLWVNKKTFPTPIRQGHPRLWLFPDVVEWRDAQPVPQRSRHGTRSRYNYGCRCDECRTAATNQHREYLESVVLTPDDPRHGTANAYRNYRCRCAPCKAAGAEANRIGRSRLAERAGPA